MQTVQESLRRYTVSPLLLKLVKKGICCMPSEKDLIPLSKEERKQQHREELREERSAKRGAQREWNSAGDIKHLALQLGVKSILAKKSKKGTQGEYLSGDTPNHWEMPWKLSLIIETLDSVILIDINNAFVEEGIPAVIAHEIGHHINQLANGYQKERKPRQSFIDGFKRAGFREYSNNFSNHFSELIAETLGQYLQGNELNAMLLAEVNKVLAKLTRKHQQTIQSFRDKLHKQNEAKMAA